jgi:hypothetical protein
MNNSKEKRISKKDKEFLEYKKFEHSSIDENDLIKERDKPLALNSFDKNARNIIFLRYYLFIGKSGELKANKMFSTESSYRIDTNTKLYHYLQLELLVRINKRIYQKRFTYVFRLIIQAIVCVQS